jgi:hypothetical protein
LRSGADSAPRDEAGHLSAHDQAAVDRERLASECRRFFTGEHGYHGSGVVRREWSRQRLARLGVGDFVRTTTTVAGMRVSPGTTAVTAMPSLPSPTARVRAIPIRAPF